MSIEQGFGKNKNNVPEISDTLLKKLAEVRATAEQLAANKGDAERRAIGDEAVRAFVQKMEMDEKSEMMLQDTAEGVESEHERRSSQEGSSVN